MGHLIFSAGGNINFYSELNFIPLKEAAKTHFMTCADGCLWLHSFNGILGDNLFLAVIAAECLESFCTDSLTHWLMVDNYLLHPSAHGIILNK